MTIGADGNPGHSTDRQWRKRRLLDLGLVACLMALSTQTSRSTIAAPGTSSSSQSDPEVLTLGPGALADRELSTGMTTGFRVDVHAGDYLRLSVAQHGTDVGVRLLTPDGETLVDVGYRQDEPKVVSAVVQTSGDYRLEIRSLETSPITGRYMAQVQQHRMAGEGDVDRVLADQLFNEAETLSIQKPTRDHYCLDRALSPSIRPCGERLETETVRPNLPDGSAKPFISMGNPRRHWHNSSIPWPSAISQQTPKVESAALAAAAGVCLDLGRMADAMKYSQLALDLSRKRRDRRGEAAALNALGDVNMFTGRSRESLGQYREALAISERLLDRRGEAQALLNLGYTYGDLAEVPDAQHSYEAALILWRALGDARGQALTLTGLGQLGAVAGDNQQALGRYRDAKALFELSGDRVGLASTLNGLGMVHFRLGEADASIAYLRRAVDLFKAVRLPNGEAGNLLDLGRCLTVLGRHREALRHNVAALVITRSIADRRARGLCVRASRPVVRRACAG